ncbi:hypothetical protein DFH05DRAFT_881993 [Lentinula detonsa]|uniref:Uncharacterized protein n=1 Tax=Lentinula detonsa TaxID=2804962 RepID=A0A9W8P6R7_9AGAR|nr:hypothetical protein DFH05DRAFT_881993 [Lentinula detonsa]
MAESSTFVGTHYILGSCYKPGELGKRSGSFTISNLNGVSGRSGWRWLWVLIFMMLPPYYQSVLSERRRSTIGNYPSARICPSQTFASLLEAREKSVDAIEMFAISGETESFGSTNLMGQWLKAVWRILCRANGLQAIPLESLHSEYFQL